MKQVLSLAVAAAVLSAGSAFAADFESGLQEGKSIGAFYVTKCAGAEEDGRDVGDNLCYRCKNGSRPQVMVFTRSSDDKVVSLIKKLDAQIKKHEESQLRAFVNVLDEVADSAEATAKNLADESSAKSVPFVVPNEHENGPENYGINPEAEVTIIFANESKVVANHAVKKASELNIEKVLKMVEAELN